MSTVKTNNVQIGQSATATNNFTWYQPASPDGTVRLGNGNAGAATDAVTVTSAGNVGIGTSSPTNKLDVQGGNITCSGQILLGSGVNNENCVQIGSGRTGNGFAYIDLIGDTTYTDYGFRIIRNNTGANATSGISHRGTGAFTLSTEDAAPIQIYTSSGERMRIDSAGNLLLGTSAFAFYSSKSTIAWDSLNQQGMVLKSTSTTYNGNPIIFLNQSNGVCGVISQSATNVNYGTSSDARLKENITDADDAASVVDAIKVRQFDWKETGEHQRYGFVAQELLEVAPETVIAPTNSDLPMSVDYSKLVPMLVKEIQSLRARLAALEAK